MQITDNLPVFGADGLHRQSRIIHQHHRCQTWIFFDHRQRDRWVDRRQAFDVHTLPARIVARAVGMTDRNYLNDTDNRFLLLRMVEKPLISQRHLAHKIPCLVIAHAIPFFALLASGGPIVPSPGIWLGFKQPILHLIKPLLFMT